MISDSKTLQQLQAFVTPVPLLMGIVYDKHDPLHLLRGTLARGRHVGTETVRLISSGLQLTLSRARLNNDFE